MKSLFGASNLRRSIVLVAVAAAMFATLGAGVAQAAVTTHVSAAYTSSSSHFHGKVSSANSECVSGRTVRLYKKTGSGRKLEGKTKSSSKGSWSVDLMHAHGKYVAVVPAQTVMSVSCGSATSKVVDVM